MKSVLSDLRHALRLYLATPWQSILAVATLAVAMAMVAATATLWSDLNLSPAPGVRDADALVSISQRDAQWGGLLNAEALAELDQRSTTLESVTGVATLAVDVNDLQVDEHRLEGRLAPVASGYFQTIKPEMALGEGLRAQHTDGDGERVLVLSHRTWQEHFQADPDIIQRDIFINDQAWRVIGVTGVQFTGLGDEPPLFWLPYRRHYLEINDNLPSMMIDSVPTFSLTARLRSGVDKHALTEELARLIESLPTSPLLGTLDGERLLVVDGLISNVPAHRSAQRQTALLLITALIMAGIAAANTGVFLLARAPGRRRELALRQCLGATHLRLTGQLLGEAALLVFVATALGLLLSLWLSASLREFAVFEASVFSQHWINLPAIALAATVAALTTGLVALMPLALLHGGLHHNSRAVSARPGVFQHVTATLQIGLAGLVGAGALAMLVHLALMHSRDLGINIDNVVAIGVSPSPSAVNQLNGDLAQTYHQRVREQLAALPGVDQVSFSAMVPGGANPGRFSPFLAGRQTLNAQQVLIGHGFFDLLQATLLHGRRFETFAESGVIVNRRFAERAWGHSDVIGESVEPEQGALGISGAVIGVVDNIQFGHPDSEVPAMVFGHMKDAGAILSTVLVRGSADPERLRQRIDSVLSETIGGGITTSQAQPLSTLMNDKLRRDRARASLIAGLAVVIALLAGFGYFAMQRYLVDAGRRETAIRMALGAGPRATIAHVFRRALLLGLPGLLIGSLLGLLGATWLRSSQYLSAAVPVSLVALAVALGLCALMLLASLQPARRAANSHPGVLLREE